ncbi:MAG: hypothetical protein GY779_06775, partial [Gammaproteobacteria bacterium]|nr:hypothetical protein [Gammaproteobacteria bacterium]
MTNKPLDYRNESGIGYVMILFILVLLSSLSLAFIAKVGTEISVIMNRGNDMQAEYLAESAANHALWRLLNEVNVTRDIRVSNNDDDAAEEYSGAMHVNDDRMDLGKWQYGGVRFLNVNIPQDSTITNAYIDVTARHSHSEDTDITIRCEDTDDATTFTSSVNDISGRTETSVSVTWNSIPGWTEGSLYQTPDLSSIIQEVVDRPGWSSGNSIVILFELTDPGGKRCIKSHDSSSVDAALLHVEYSGTDLPASNVYTMHSLAGGRYGYKIRSHTDTTFATIATVGAIGNQVVKQGYVVYVKPESLPVVLACPKNLLYVVGDSLNLTTKETTRKTLMEGWNANVTLLSDSAPESEYDTGIAANDVVYCSPSAVGASILDKLTGKDIGIVNEVLGKLDNFGFCSSYMSTSVDTFTASDPAHYITSPFDGDDINFFTLSLSTTGLGGTLAPDLHNLGEVSGVPSMAALSTGDQRYDGDPAPNRRVFLPFTNAETDQITTDGQYLMMRAIEWAAHMDTGCSTGTSLLFVVKDAGSLTTQETARKTLMESWGFAVTLIDDDDTQANFDSAAAANSAAYISQEALATSVGAKLTSKTIGVVNENKDMVDDLGFVTGLSIGGGLPTMNVDSSHYITSVFTTNPVSAYAATEWYMIYDIPVATGVYQLGKWAESPWSDRPALMTLCQGGSIIGGGTAAGRRVQLPWGSGQGDTPVDINNSLTD